MTHFKHLFPVAILFSLLCFNNLFAQNPLILDQFTADPTARVFEGKVYLYPSHDIHWSEVNSRENWFCMRDYHVFSSENLTEWTDHGVIVSQENVPWVNSETYSMWAPDCIARNGKYYFYFPAIAKESTGHKGMGVGVAISDKPYGPFTPEPMPIAGITGIDPNIFIDKDGQAYIYWAGMRRMQVAKLKNNMLEIDSEPQEIAELPEKMKEGPFVFERKGIYYFTFPMVEDSTEELVYAIGDNPMGPFKMTGVIMDQSPVGCWTNHHSIIEYDDQWYLFYHHNELSPSFDKNRSVMANSLFFNEDGTIQKVIPTLRGIGITAADKKIQIDRYSAISQEGINVTFIDTTNKHLGWKTVFNETDSWIRFNSVHFAENNFSSVNMNVLSDSEGMLEIRLDKADGPVAAIIKIDGNKEWKIINSQTQKTPEGVHDLFVIMNEGKDIEVDWLKFE